MTFPPRSQSQLAAPNFEAFAIAQSSEVKPVIVQPQTPIQASPDLSSILLTAIISGGSVWLGFGRKFGDSVIANRRTQADIIKSQADIELSEEKAKLDQTKELFNLILDTLREERKTTKGILDILLTKYLSSTTEVAENAVTQQELLRNLTERLHSQERTLERVDKGMQDIFNKLGMGTRENV